MLRYHFHMDDDGKICGDIAGRELVDDAAAISEAGLAAADATRDQLSGGPQNSKVVVTVEDSDGMNIAIIRLSADVDVP